MSSFGAGTSRSDGGDGGPAETAGGILASLHELKRLLGSGDPGTCAAALGLLRSLGEECVISAPGSSVLALNTSLVFSKDYGLLEFIHKSLIMEEYRDCREEALKFLVTFLEKIGQNSQPYALEIKKICVIAYTKEKYAKCKVAALDLLIKLLQILKKSYTIEEFKISELFNKFYGELANKTKLSDTVLEKIYELLGILGEVQPSDMLNNSEKLFRAYLGELKGQMTSSTRQPKFAVVAGCLRGLSALLINFTKSVEEDASASKEIFEYTMKAINPQIDLKRYAVPLAGLHLLAQHASQFDTFLMDSYQKVFEVMSKWCGHSNHEMKKNAFAALDSFLKQMALLVTNDAVAHKDKLQFFMGQFYKIMRKMESSNKELAIAIRGYGLFAAPCKAVNATDVNFMYIELIQRCKQMYLTEVETEDDNVYQLPNFLQAIASVILYMDSIPEIYTPVLERLLVVQIETFPQYSSKMQFSCSRSIIKVFLSLAGKGPVLWSLISTVVHQGLIRVCSKPVRFERDGYGAVSSDEPSASREVRAGKWKVPSFKDYLDLFHSLLNCDQIKESIFSDEVFPAVNSPLQSLSRLLYDELIKSILKIIDKLDLSLQKQESGQLVDEDHLGYLVIATSDPAANLYPTKPKDFTAFVNLVDFCSEIIPNKHVEFFEPWVYVFGYEIVLKSTRLPLISGFYRLLSVVMKNAKKLKYFEGVSLNSSGKCPQNPEKMSCFALFLKFGKEVSSKMKQFKDELLASCLTFILSLPPDIIKHDMKAYIPSLQMAFKLGLSFPPLADAGLDALDDWSSQIPSDIEKFYKDILPSLDSYLTDTSSSEESLSALDVDRLSRASQKGFNKYLIKQIQRTKSLSVKDEYSLVAVRNRVVRLLGSLGGQINRSLVTATSTEEMIKKHVSWDTEKRLSFAVPFADMKPVIYLDTFLPRVTDLALSASDRQTKVAACELLHSMVTYMLGKASQIPDAREGPPPMYRLYKHTFPVLLCLACDVDQVTRQLYEPLVMGIIHWFTNNKKFESRDTVALLDSILDGIVDPGNSTLRDFSGRCIQEFLKWSIKQTTPRQQEQSPVNTQSLFKRLYSLALHPNAFKRLGAALAFNNVYKEFREEDALVEKFVFEILVVYMQSLALCHGDEKSLGTIQQCSDAIDHLKRIIIQKVGNLNKSSKRRIPRGFPQSQTICLLDIVLWLLQQCGLPQTDCRHKAMELFFELVPVLPEKKSPSAWVEEIIKKESVSFLIQRFESAGSVDGNHCGIFYITTLQDLNKTSLRAVIQWMDMLLAALDCYNTFLGMRVVKPQTLLDPSQKSSFLRALHFFISHLSMNDVMAAATCLKASLFSPQEKEEYNYNKCTIIVRIIEFVTVILDNCQQDFWKNLEDELLNNSMWELAAVTICDPLSIGFNTADVQVMKNLPDVCVQLLKAVAKSPYKRILETCLQKKITMERIEDLCTVNLCDPDTRHQSVKLGATLSACNQLYKAQLLTSVLHAKVTGLGITVGSKLLSVVYKGIAASNDRKSLPSLDISSKRLAEGILQLAFNFGGQCEELVSLLLNTVVLTVPLSGSSQRNFINFSHGEYFYSLFSETINRELLKNLDTVVPHLLNSSTENPKMVSSVLNGMLDQSFRQRSVQKQQGTQLVNSVLKNWMKLESWWATDSSPESKMAVLTLLAKVLQIESTVSCDTNHPAFNDIFSTYLSILLDQKLGLNLKSQTIIILPFFTNLKEERLTELKHTLDQFVAFNFPMKSDEFPKGTLKFNNYVDCVKKFLDALELSQSPVLLQLMAEILCRDNEHFMEDLFQNTFKKVVKRSSCDKQVILLDTLHNMFKSEDLLSNTTRHSLVDHCLLTLLWNCSSEALKDFFSKIINFSMDFLKSRFTKTSEAVFDTQLTKKMGYYKMLEVLFSRLSKDEIHSKESRINHAFEGSVNVEGKQLTRTLIKSCHDAYTENMSGEKQLLEKRRLYHCAAYNCAIAVGLCTFTESKFYQAFLFSEKKEKSTFILENIIDLKHHYSFPIEVEVPMERKKKYLAIRKEAREAANEDSDEPQYLSSQSYMADSSLSEEMSQFDFSTGIQSFSYSSQDPVRSQRSRRVRDRSSEVQQTAEDVMEFEMDELNQHECMAPMTGLIKRMSQNGITPKVEEGKVPQDLPPWMTFLHSKLGNTSTPLNIRLFISKLVVNSEEVFRPYAKFWIGPLLQLIVSGNNGGTGIHYLVVETVVTLLSWSSVATPNGLAKDEILANRLLEFMMKNSFHEKRAVYRHNLEIIKTLLECWKDCLCIPYKLIFDDFSGTDPDKKDNSVGIQLLGLVVANNFSPYDPKCEIDMNRYFQALANNVTFTRFKEVYAAAAEVLGLVLRYIADKEKNVEGPVFNYVEKNLKSLHTSNNEDKFIVCLNKIVKNCPLFADRFMNIVLYQLPKLHGVLKTQCLEVIMSRSEEIPDLFLELKNRNFKQIMSNRDDERQRVCLDIVYKLLAKLKPSELRELLPSVIAFSCHKFPVCRERMYDILMWIYDNYRDLESQSDSDSQEVFNMAKEALLEGLVDENAELQLIVRNFWSTEPRLPTGTMDRLVAILCSLCSTKIKKHFLSLATNLLLEMTSRSPDYIRQMFEHPLSECMFQDYTVDSNWRNRSTILTPMFVETQASQSIYRSRTQSFQEGQEPEGGQVRATQQHFQFTPTQNIGGRSSFNWLTGNTLDTLGSYSADSSESLSTALLFTSRRSEKAQRGSFKPLGPNFGKRRLGLPGDETDSKTKGIDERSEILRLRRRFLKDKEKLSIIYAKKGVAEQKREKEIKVEQKMKKDAQVILYRSYRHGDLPDIQIAHSALIAPLQALAQKDSTLAKQLFSALFSGILERIGSSTEKNSIAAKLVDKFNQYLNSTMYYFPPFIGCIQDMCYHHVELLDLNPASVSTSSIESLQQSIGILLLEKALQYISPPEDPPAKKMRGRANPPLDVQRWIQLAQLYRSIGDYDVLRGIFSNKIGTKSITQLALNAEAKSDYGEAAKLYDKALQETFPDGEPSDAEKDFWEIASMDCYNHLTEWEPLEYCSTVNIDSQKPPDLKKMWSDPFYEETYLPYMIRSKVKLLLNGKADQSLLTFIDDAMKIEQRKVLIENFYSLELSLLYILQDDFDRARYYIKNGIDMFIQNYSSVDSLLYHSRLTELQTVQALTETQDFINFIHVPGNLSSLPSLRRLFHLWMSRYPDDKMDPMHIWDDVISNRCFFLDKIKDKLSCQLVDESMEIDDTTEDSEEVHANKQEDVNFLIRKCKFVMKMKMIDSARKQNNFSVAMKLLKELHRESKTNEDWLVKWVHSYCRYSHSRIQSQSNPERILTVLKTVPLLEESSPEYLNRFPQSYRYHNMLLGGTYKIMGDALSKQPDCLNKIEESKARKVTELAGSAEEIAAGLYRKCLHYLKSAVRRAEEETQSHSEERTDNKGAIKAYMTLVDFCDAHLRKLEDNSSVLDVKDWKPFPEIIVDKMIKALKLGSKEARLKFPRLLQIIELYPNETFDLMAREVSSVPCWLFIGWISQMMAMLDKKESLAVQFIIEQIADYYPQSLVYPFMISGENYNFEDTVDGHRNKLFVEKIRSKLEKNGLIKDFILALEQLSNPALILQDWKEDFDKELARAKPDRNKIKMMYREMYAKLGNSKDPTFGAFRRRFAEKYSKEFDKVCGKDGSLLREMKAEVFAKNFGTLVGKIKSEQGTEPGNLKEYSPWMSNFKPEFSRGDLEIPGQYDGKGKPMPEYHVKICGFDERVKVMSSIRKPKRIIIRGNDERDYPFLVKGGEDLRQDQRIEQLFDIMNIILSQDAACKQRYMQVKTYQVVPMTTRIGMIEWLENTCTLKEFISSTLTESERKDFNGKYSPEKHYKAWLDKKDKIGSPQQHIDAYSKVGRDSTISSFREREALVPGDLLRRAFVKMSATPEAFLALRSHFVRSHALLCISHWILGIGDRHLSNFMVNMETGGMIGIDFGHAFGTATQFLPVPELMPFRLTRQIINLMLPLKETGLFDSVMVHALRAYRTNPDLLISTMDVFVKEPSLDWKNFEAKQLKKRGDWVKDVNTTSQDWYPMQKVACAKRKLSGVNPAIITCEELRLGHAVSKAFKHLCDVAKGDKEYNIRAGVPDDELSEEIQVKCLIDQATDPNILGRVWIGWEPWM